MEHQQKDCHYEELSPTASDSKQSFGEDAESFLDSNVYTRSGAPIIYKTLTAWWLLVVLQILVLFIATGSLVVGLNNRSQKDSQPVYFCKLLEPLAVLVVMLIILNSEDFNWEKLPGDHSPNVLGL